MSSDYEAITKHNERQLGLDTASRKTQICMYSDSTHFVYEILQNADDYGATEVFFKLSKNELLIEHNGEPFKEENVKAITYFGKSTSRDDLVKTGRFGVGFKSVFAFTGSPIVISGNEHFQIYGLYRVREYPYPSDFSRSRTRIVLPFNHDTERPDYVEEFISKEEAYSKISTRLTELNMNTLLFTRNICEIRWEIGGRSGHYFREDAASDNGRWTTITNGEQLRKYLVFSRIPKWKNQEYKAVEIAFAVDDKSQLMPTDDFLYVLFATTQETHLQFILNGPYRTNPSRETISEEDHFNIHLMKEACILMKEVLQRLREMGLLTMQFLAVLPNNTDKLRAFYAPLFEATVETFREYELVPTDDNQYASASNVFQGPATLREVITKEELPFFLGHDNACWAKGVQQNSRPDNFLRGLDIQQWGFDQLQEALETKYGLYAYRRDDADNEWLATRSDAWLQKLYILLADAIKRRECSEYSLKNCRIIRALEGGEETYVAGSRAFFPKGRSYKDLPQVKYAILRGRNEQASQKIHESLIALGVSDIGDEERIDLILETFYEEEVAEVAHQQHLQHMSTFIKWWKKEKNASKFGEYAIFFSLEDGQLSQRKPANCYLDAPIRKSGLDVIYRDKNCKLRRKWKIWSGYRKIASDDFFDFVIDCGVADRLIIRKQTCDKHPNQSFLRQDYNQWGVKFTYTGINHDYTINELIDLLKMKNGDISLLIWRTLSKAAPEVLEACFRPNQQYDPRTDKSSLVIALSKAQWIPDKKGHLLKPCEIAKEMLHKDFRYDDKNGWLTAIGFGENEKKKTWKYKTFATACKDMGFTDEEIEFMKEIKESGLSPEELKDFSKQMKTKKRKQAFPEKESDDPGRRESKIKEKLATAPEKQYEVRERSIRTTSNEIKPDVKIYLRNNYTNENGDMICQICEEEMPFKLADGSYYFEAVECVENFPKECRENYIALCPVCAAKFKHANNSKPKDIRALITKADELTIPITLARESKSIRFVKTHLEDLKAIFKSK